MSGKTTTMNRTHFISAAWLATLALPMPAMADFLGDSHARLELRNHYLNRDFRQSNAGQGRGMGPGLYRQAGVGLHRRPGRLWCRRHGPTGHQARLQPRPAQYRPAAFGPNSHEPVDDYSELGLTGKVRVAKSTLRLGTLQPILPVVVYNDTRLLASTFQGGLLTSQDLAGLTFNAGRLTKANLRDSSGRDDIGYGAASSDHLDFGGGSYAITPQTSVSYYYAKLEDIYRQQFVGLIDTRPLGEGLSLRTDLRYFDSRNDGAERAGNIDNRNFNALFTLGVRAHKFTAAWQQMSGDSAFPFVNGGDPFTVNTVTYNTFTRAGLDSWQVRYDYDFVAMGIPGLSFMTRYTDGRHAETATVSNGRERERDTDITYVIQSGPFRDVSLRWRNVTFRSGNGLTNAVDENRLIIGYTVALW